MNQVKVHTSNVKKCVKSKSYELNHTFTRTLVKTIMRSIVDHLEIVTLIVYRSIKQEPSLGCFEIPWIMSTWPSYFGKSLENVRSLVDIRQQ